MTYENILVETRGKVGLLTLNRPKAMNALSPDLMRELGEALLQFEADEDIGAMVITGSEKAFAAGADIKAMREWGYMDVYKSDYITAEWETVARCRKPVIAAVAGYALGGGCELASATSSLPLKLPNSVSRRSTWASFPGPEGPSVYRALSANPRPWRWCCSVRHE
jgi:enoyl-CoA hydratase/carnithine racemase